MTKILKERKLNLFDFLGKISTKQRNVYSSLTEEEKKEVSPFVIMQWLSGTSSARQVFFLNEVVNSYAFSLQKHKELLIQLMIICTGGKPQRYNWIKKNKKKTPSTPKLIGLIQQYFGYSSKEATDVLPLLTDMDILSYTSQMGYQPEDIKIIKKEMKKREQI